MLDPVIYGLGVLWLLLYSYPLFVEVLCIHICTLLYHSEVLLLDR